MPQQEISKFTIRVYGLLIVEHKILLSRENIKGGIYTKFPGGGLEFGEGIVDCVKREFMEEVAIELSETKLFHLTEDFIPSAFHDSKQVISIYYKVATNQIEDIKTGDPNDKELLKNDDDQVLYWCRLQDLGSEPIELPIDRQVVRKLLSE